MPAFLLLSDPINNKIHNLISGIRETSGNKIIYAIILTERAEGMPVLLCNEQPLHKKIEKVIAAWQGNYEEQYIFALTQALFRLNFSLLKIHKSGQQMEFI